MRVPIFFLFLATLVASDSESEKFSCYVRYHYAQSCYRFTFEKDCQPYQLDKCQPSRVTYKDFHCPRYFCVSIICNCDALVSFVAITRIFIRSSLMCVVYLVVAIIYLQAKCRRCHLLTISKCSQALTF